MGIFSLCSKKLTGNTVKKMMSKKWCQKKAFSLDVLRKAKCEACDLNVNWSNSPLERRGMKKVYMGSVVMFLTSFSFQWSHLAVSSSAAMAYCPDWRMSSISCSSRCTQPRIFTYTHWWLISLGNLAKGFGWKTECVFKHSIISTHSWISIRVCWCTVFGSGGDMCTRWKLIQSFSQHNLFNQHRCIFTSFSATHLCVIKARCSDYFGLESYIFISFSFTHVFLLFHTISCRLVYSICMETSSIQFGLFCTSPISQISLRGLYNLYT